jgi:hypothetical protein
MKRIKMYSWQYSQANSPEKIALPTRWANDPVVLLRHRNSDDGKATAAESEFRLERHRTETFNPGS